MQKWEYLSQKSTRGTKGSVLGREVTEWESDFSLKSLGQEGWELVSVVPVASIPSQYDAGVTTEVMFFFKRPME